MAKVSPKLTSQSGLSLVELLVVVVVIAIVASMAIINRGTANEQYQRQNVAYGLKNAFERARFDSVKRRPEAVVDHAFVNVANLSFTMGTDIDSDRVLEVAENRITDFSADNITIQYLTGPTAANLPASVTFNFRGEPTALGADATPVAPAFLVCNGTCAGGRNASNSTIVLVTPSGTVNLLSGDSGVPTFGIPPISTIPGSSLINDLVSYIGPSPSPVPTVTPDPGGSPTPTPGPGDPTPTPDPGGTPTPTPGPGDPTPTPSPTATPAPTATPVPTATPTVTPTATPVPCSLTAPTATTITYSGNGPRTIPVSFINGSGNTISLSVTGGGDDWAISPSSATALGASGTFNATFSYKNGNNGRGTGTLRISGCGATKVITLTVT